MRVTFTRTGERRYKVSVEGKGLVPSEMDPAPGYDPLLPHDMAHFVVENALGLMGVFGQLAEGGHAHTFRPINEPKNSRAAKRGDRISKEGRRDAELSERVIYRAQQTWMKADMTNVPKVEDISAQAIQKICDEFQSVSAIWSKLPVGGSMTLEWNPPVKSHKASRRK